MSRASDANFDASEPLLELPAAVLAPRRVVGDGPQRFGRSRSSSSSPVTVIAQPSARPATANAGSLNSGTSSATGDGQEKSHLQLVLLYITVAFVFQMALLIPAFTGFRVPLRMFPFASSILLVAFPPKKKNAAHRLHPAVSAAIVVFAIVSFGLLNEQTESFIAGAATVAFYTAILAPLIWVGRLQISERGFVTIVTLLWTLSVMSSAVGVLQVAYPGQFTPATSQIILQQQEMNNVDLGIHLANGQEMQRPYGLTDQPGGVAGPGLTAFIFGLGLLATTKRPGMIAVYAAGMAAGLFVIYLCQVRVALVTIFVAVIGFLALLVWRGEFKRLSRVMVALGIIVTISTVAALGVGGTETANRVLTLVAEDPGSVYYSNRGFFLDLTFNYLLPQYPIGAGLGRYGMMATYFAADKGLGAHSLWAEIQWTAWVYDGGLAMIACYPIALILALVATLKITLDRKIGVLGVWGTILAAYNISAIAITFSYCLFLSQSGLEFWMLNATIFSAYQLKKRNARVEVPEGFESVQSVWRPGISMPTPASDLSAAPFTPTPFGSRRRALGNRPLPAIRAMIDPPESDGPRGTSV